ncbi:MAG: TlpA disulfide reductase family protein [Chloroflexota bacterium]
MTSAAQSTRRSASRRVTWSDPRVILALGAALIVVALALLYVTRGGSGPSPHDFTLPGMNGDTVSLADYRGRYVLVNFWATWCPPCRDEMPDLQAYYNAYRDQGFTLLAINEAEDPATVRRFVGGFGFTFPVALDTTGAVMDQYGTESLPTSFLIGPDGRLVKSWIPGRLNRATLERDITPLLKG